MNDSGHHNGDGRPEYGAMRSDYPAYDPYLYGAPDPSPSDGQPAAPAQLPQQSVPQQSVHPQPQAQTPVPPMPYARGAGGRFGVNLDDPRQNPLYGRWDPYAIVAFVFAILFANMPLLPAVMGGLSMWRTRTFRMKGFGLALAAVIINLLTSLLVLWAAYNGMSLQDMVLDMYGLGTGGSGSSGSDADVKQALFL